MLLTTLKNTCCATLVAVTFLINSPLEAQTLYGLGSSSGVQTLSQFDTAGSPIGSAAPITGLGSDVLVDIDFFTSGDGQLYGLAQTGNLYTINITQGISFGAATLNTTGAIGTPVAIDFNPSADRLRVLSGASNYRITPGTGVVTADGNFAYAVGDVNFGATPNLVAAAYTNNFDLPPSTSLYTIDASLNTLVLNTVGPQFSTLTTVAGLTLGGNPFDVGLDTGFDIFGVNTAYLSSGQNLYSLNLSDGTLTSLGFASGATNLTDIAAVPEPGTVALIGLGAFGLLCLRRRR